MITTEPNRFAVINRWSIEFILNPFLRSDVDEKKTMEQILIKLSEDLEPLKKQPELLAGISEMLNIKSDEVIFEDGESKKRFETNLIHDVADKIKKKHTKLRKPLKHIIALVGASTAVSLFALLAIPFPGNLIMSSGALMPMIFALIKIKKAHVT